MPRKKAIQSTRKPELSAPPQLAADKKWAEPYRPVVTNPEAGFELGENKLANLMVFNFAEDPGVEVKDKLKHYGYHYHTDQKAWTVNATPLTREIARKLAAEFAAAKGIVQEGSLPPPG